MSARPPALVLVHAVWATVQRKPTLPASIDERLRATLGDKAADLGCTMLAAGSARDHVHVVVRLRPSVPLSLLVQRMKGGSAFDLNRHLALPRRIAWQVGYWAESIGPADLGPVARYVRHQREHHDDSHPIERWMVATEEASSPLAPGRGQS